jgi:SAM-dependent methyltransferase
MKCNICGWEGDKFEPRFATKGRLCVCPSCRSLDRNRHLYHVISELEAGSQTNTLSLLDIAPSPMMMKRFRKAYLYAAVDLQQFTTDIVQMNVHQLEFPDNYFDRVMCSHVLEHIRDDQGAMREIYRVTAPGGVLLCQVPYKEDNPTKSIAEPDQHGHVWDYGDESFAHRLVTAGFRTSRSSYRDDNPEYGFDPLHVFIGRKPGGYEPSSLSDLG